MQVDRLTVQVYSTRPALGAAAAVEVAATIAERLRGQEVVRVMFAAAPSQNEFLAALCSQEIAWPRVVAFQIDEYIGLPEEAPQRFSRFLRESLFDKVSLKHVHYLTPKPEAAEQGCRQYAELLQQREIDIACLGIGENGHLAFNDPPVADFKDPQLVKVVELDEICRQQQVNDGAFAELAAVPRHAVTLTIPALMSAHACFVIVPGPRKAEAVHAALQGPVAESCPASILRRHQSATLFLDREAAGKL
jgi:glucosamine-6-phosphate deaminase